MNSWSSNHSKTSTPPARLIVSVNNPLCHLANSDLSLNGIRYSLRYGMGHEYGKQWGYARLSSPADSPDIKNTHILRNVLHKIRSHSSANTSEPQIRERDRHADFEFSRRVCPRFLNQLFPQSLTEKHGTYWHLPVPFDSS